MKLLIVGLIILFLSALCITGRLSDRDPVFRTLLYIDMFLCALFLNNPDMTISSRCGLALLDPNGNSFLRGIGRVLNVIQKNHTTLAIKDDLARAKEAQEILNAPNQLG